MTTKRDSDSTAPWRSLASVIVLCFGGLMTTLTHTMVLPIQGDFPGILGTSGSSAAWIVTIFVVAAAVTMPVAGRLGDLLGKRRMLVYFTAILLVGSVVCALSDSLPPMLVGRTFQGVGMGFFPIGISLISTIAQPRHRVTAIAAMSANVGVGGAIGLPFGGWVASEHSWHALFWIVAALVAVVLVAVILVVPAADDGHPGTLDIGGVIGLAVGLVAFLVGVSKGTTWGWGDPATLGCIVGGLLALAMWAAYELTTTAPLVDLRTSVRPVVLLTNLTAMAVGFGMLAQAIVIPQLLRLPTTTGYGLGQSIFAAGLWMAPSGLIMLLSAWLSKSLVRRIGAIHTMMAGSLLVAAGYMCALVMMDSPWKLMLTACVASTGVALAYAVMPILLFDAVRTSEAGATIGMNLLLRSVGTALASAVMATVLSGSTQIVDGTEVASASAFRLCFMLGAVAAFAAACMALLVGRVRPSVDAVKTTSLRPSA